MALAGDVLNQLKETHVPIITVSTSGGFSIGISQDINLVHYNRNGLFPVSLGPATTENIQSIIDALERLKKHAR